MHVDLIFLQIIREWLFDVENHGVKPGRFPEQSIQNFVHVIWMRNSAIKISRQPVDAISDSHTPYLQNAVVIPFRIVAAQFNLETTKPVALDPISEKNWVAIVRLISR